MIQLPRDLYAHGDARTEWWYYTGHLSSTDGHEFSFELVFFKRRTDIDRVGILPLRYIANPMYAAHFAIGEPSAASFRYEHRRNFGTSWDTEVEMSDDCYSLRLGDWTIREHEEFHILHATFRDGTSLDITLLAAKPAIRNGLDLSGLTRRPAGDSHHFSITRLAAAGCLRERGREIRLTGAAWLDREFGSADERAWDWFAVQLDDGSELMIYRFRDDRGSTLPYSYNVLVDIDGNSHRLTSGQVAIEVLSTWTSPNSGATYPSGWAIRVPDLELTLEITPSMADQELDTRGTTMVIYWEGSCNVTGVREGMKVAGRAFVELVGYDRSHEQMDLVTFLVGEPVRWLRGRLS